MFITDKLSTELNVNYMDLFNKTNEYNHSENRKFREDVRLHRVFLEKEIDFLACFALEFLKENNIDSGNKMNEVNVEELNDFANSVESERDELSTELLAYKEKVQEYSKEKGQFLGIQYELAALLKKMESIS